MLHCLLKSWEWIKSGPWSSAINISSSTSSMCVLWEKSDDITVSSKNLQDANKNDVRPRSASLGLRERAMENHRRTEWLWRGDWLVGVWAWFAGATHRPSNQNLSELELSGEEVTPRTDRPLQQDCHTGSLLTVQRTGMLKLWRL